MRPTQFQSLSVVRLLTAAKPPPSTSADEEIQDAHIAYLMGLRDRGLILANGPARRVDDPLLRGLSIYSVPPEEARRLAEGDPAVEAGWFVIHVDGWLIPVSPVTLGDRVDVEM